MHISCKEALNLFLEKKIYIPGFYISTSFKPTKSLIRRHYVRLLQRGFETGSVRTVTSVAMSSKRLALR